MSKPIDDVSAPFKGNIRSDKGNADRKGGPLYRCPLCGYKFSWKEGEKVCQTCFIKNHCTLIMCPRCHHEFPKT